LAAPDRRALFEAVTQTCIDRGCVYAAIVPAREAAEPFAVAGSAGRVLARYAEPIRSDGLVLGRLEVGFPAELADPDVSRRLVLALATVIGAATKRVDAFAAQHRVADRLQRALLPSDLPEHPAIRFDAAYRPATDETVVGGDWYDAFEIGDGRIGVSIGDVAGHGLEAAVAMGEARRAIRTAAAGFGSPSEMLDYVNGILALHEGIGMATAIAGFFDPRDATFRYASAGHPPPILVASDRRPHALPAGGLPLGLGPAIASPDWTVTIDAGTSVVMYTDGLLEYSRDIVVGERLLREALAETDIGASAEPAEALHSAIFSSVDNTDDAATLVLRGLGDAPSPRMRSSSFPAAAAIVRGSLRRHLQHLGASRDISERVLGAVGEAIANAIEHGRDGGAFEVDVEHVDDGLQIDVRNEGPWREFLANEERGRGLPIMQAFADGVAITTTSSSTGIRLTFGL
jgi:anti-sigma regulatory factor (Ser/Thr protein kinase)